jgi:hypothetical protein
MKRIGLLLALAVLGACPPTPAPDPVPSPEPDPVMPPMPLPPSGATCDTACAHATEMHCDWSQPTPNGATCTDVCKASQDFGDRWDLACRTAAASCGMAEACEQ